ncbi:pyruvate kinase [Mycoplasma sp. 'Moose RK']|uniref:pyruvate kinase n=1 Tax=Mycoplasma sp. 'Moose RK' TaxID=2780095 RepID=UPI0035BE5801
MKNYISKRTKIIATIGPATQDYQVLKNLVLAGVSVIRANFSHGTHDEQREKFASARRLSSELQIPISVMLDTKGPEIRVGKIKDSMQKILANQELTVLTDTFSYKNFEGTSETITVSHQIDKDLKIGDRVLFDDGKLQSIVIKIEDKKVIVRTKNSHILRSNKRLNMPGVAFSLPFLSQKDIDDVLFGISENIDYVAASFVNSAVDVQQLRDLLDKNGGSHIQIISKIESKLGLENIDEIIEFSDGIMVARGDLGLEVPYEEVPFQQKRIIRKCRFAGKTVVVATQMLDSMEKSSQPTRAEVSDVYWATELGADATMLSGESAQGQFPVESVQVMSVINKRAEKEFYNKLFYTKQLAFITQNSRGQRAKIAHKLAHLAYEKKIKYTIVLSRTGQLLKTIAKFRPNTAVIGVLNNEKLINGFGITSSVFVSINSINEFEAIKKDYNHARNVLKPFGVEKGDTFLVVENEKMTQFIY